MGVRAKDAYRRRHARRLAGAGPGPKGSTGRRRQRCAGLQQLLTDPSRPLLLQRIRRLRERESASQPSGGQPRSTNHPTLRASADWRPWGRNGRLRQSLRVNEVIKSAESSVAHRPRRRPHDPRRRRLAGQRALRQACSHSADHTGSLYSLLSAPRVRVKRGGKSHRSCRRAASPPRPSRRR